jgi:hypothetical protein
MSRVIVIWFRRDREEEVRVLRVGYFEGPAIASVGSDEGGGFIGG